jgi:TPP-dependent pyruvate/acetoin dehydrogenase alpha subunit
MTDRRNAVQVERLLAHLTLMTRIRAFEEAADSAQQAGHVKGAVHLSIGQEAIASGVCGHLTHADPITTTHRGHGHTIAKGADPRAMMAELFGKATGSCGGKGGSMHIADFGVGMLGANGVVAAGLPIAVGAAQGLRLLGRKSIVGCFFGDGAVNRGPFLESLNWAAIFHLPVLFICEDNEFSATTRTGLVSGGPGVPARAESLGVKATTVDGNDVEAVDAATAEIVARLREGGGPELLHARTYRLRGHTATDAAAYRPADEVAAKRLLDPVERLRARLSELGVATEVLAAIQTKAAAEMASAVDAAIAAPFADAAGAYTDITDLGTEHWR